MNHRIIKNLAVLRDLPEGETAKWEHPENGTTHIFEFVPSTRGCEACVLDKFNHNCSNFCESEYRNDKKFGIFKELPDEEPKTCENCSFFSEKADGVGVCLNKANNFKLRLNASKETWDMVKENVSIAEFLKGFEPYSDIYIGKDFGCINFDKED